MTESILAKPPTVAVGAESQAACARRRAPRLAREVVIGIALGVLLVFLILWSMTIGAYDLTVAQAGQTILAQFGLAEPLENTKIDTVLLVIRLPRILLTAIVGAALAASGAAYQGLFKNPMVAPDILGVSSGAGAGAALAILARQGSRCRRFSSAWVPCLSSWRSRALSASRATRSSS